MLAVKKTTKNNEKEKLSELHPKFVPTQRLTAFFRETDDRPLNSVESLDWTCEAKSEEETYVAW